MSLAVEITPILLHLSVCLFFWWPRDNLSCDQPRRLGGQLAIAVDVAVGNFGLPHTVITILPFIDVTSLAGARWPISLIILYMAHQENGSFLTLLKHL